MRAFLFSFAVLAACGGDSVNHLADAPPGIDAAPDAENGPVTLTVTIDGAPQAGITTFFLGPDSSVVSSTSTDANGGASAIMPSGGFVVAVNPWGMIAGKGGSDLRVFAGVKTGDHLVLPYSSGQGVSITFSLNAPLDSNIAAARHDLFTSCGTAANLTGDGDSVTLYNCNGTADMLVVSYDVNGNVLDSLFQAAVAVADDSTVDLTGTYVAALASTFTYTDGAGVLPGMSVRSGVVTSRGLVFDQFSYPALTNGGVTVAQKRPAAGSATAITETQFNLSGTGRQIVSDWGAPSATYTLDLGAVALPSYTAYPTFDPATSTMSFATTGGTTTPDLIVMAVFDDSFGYRITMVAPFSGSTATFPHLPLDGTKDWNIQAADNASVATVILATVPGGYDAVRPDAHALLTFNNIGDTLLAGPSGHVVVETTD